MKMLLVIAVFFMLARVSPGQEIKKWKITDLESYIRQSDHPIIVNFWATFCTPCIEEIPYFQKLTAKYKKAGVELLLVSVDLPDYFPDKISTFARNKKFTAQIAWLNETNADYFCPRIDKKWSGAIPSTLFVNNKTKYRRFYETAMTELQVENTIQDMIEQ